MGSIGCFFMIIADIIPSLNTGIMKVGSMTRAVHVRLYLSDFKVYMYS